MKNLFLFFIILFSLSTTAKNTEVSKVLNQVFNDSTIYQYLSTYGGIDSLGYVVFENQGNYYIYNGNFKNKESALSHPSIGVIRKMKISADKAIVKIYITNNHFNIKAKLSRIDSCQPWLIDSRLICNLFQIRGNQQRLFHYSNG